MGKFENKKVLIVEDDALLSEMLARKFLDEKAMIAHAIDGEVALSMIAQNTYDLILLDLLLPKINGYEVLESVQTNDKTKKVPVIILSNLGQKTDVDRGMKLGAKKFLVKALLSVDEIINASVEVLG